MMGSSRIGTQLAASQEGLGSMSDDDDDDDDGGDDSKVQLNTYSSFTIGRLSGKFLFP
jgi:hypothetical protein